MDPATKQEHDRARDAAYAEMVKTADDVIEACTELAHAQIRYEEAERERRHCLAKAADARSAFLRLIGADPEPEKRPSQEPTVMHPKFVLDDPGS